MSYYLTCIAALVGCYVLHMTYTSVFYHRAFSHDALVLKPWLTRFVAASGIWVTGIDPKPWVCMHRLHHLYSDQPRDPHSPVNAGIMGVMTAQLNGYVEAMKKLRGGDPEYCELMADLAFPLSPFSRPGLFAIPCLVQSSILAAIGWASGAWLLVACVWWGLYSHAFEGWLVNSLAHAIGPRNFDTPDNSRNNFWVALYAMGEGLQNNHHYAPASARLAYRHGEPDAGYGICLFLQALGLLKIRQETLLERAPA